MKRTIKITESQMRKIIDRISEGEYHIDEEEQMTVYEKGSNPDLGKIPSGTQFGIKDSDGKIRTYTANESDDLLDEDIFLEEEEIDPSRGFEGLPMA